ncbi:metallophosphoesterase (TIGR03767 family) [Nakamurella sp. UYEF19]|uniref:TIGR03767 family metallophosphoesterase n=1 Tax=Nakamurella sp. UYEF19 TaxID=1756392 RepID=UPI003396FFF3
MTLTHRSSITGGTRSDLGYWPLAAGPGEPHVARSELIRGAGRPADSAPLLTVAHLSDLHLCDSQSPARGEFLDRWSDPDSPLRPTLGHIGSYRAQDCLTVQVGAAMVDAINAVGRGPVGGAEIDWAITTGDVVDSAQTNELGWYIGLLDGGRIVPDSGALDRYEGVADHGYWHEAFWHPDPSVRADGSARSDRPHRLFGFPDAPGLLDALRAPFDSPGLSMPWIAVHGNHDQLVQGNIPAVGDFALASMADTKAIDVPAHWTLEQIARFCGAVDSTEQIGLDAWGEMLVRTITPDALRRTITREEFLDAHFGPRARPAGHGFAADHGGRAYYRYDHDGVTVLVLDAVNEHGGWQGSLDEPQLVWLESELTDADRERRHVVLASHHTLADLVNDRLAPAAARRVLTAELTEILDGHPCVVLWLNGHTHLTRVTPHTGRHSWWEVTAPSLIDFPQQGRIVELLRSPGGTLTVAVTMVDHSGELPWSGSLRSTTAMAGLSRQLAANDWQFRPEDLARHVLVGTPTDRNVLLHLPDPWA